MGSDGDLEERGIDRRYLLYDAEDFVRAICHTLEGFKEEGQGIPKAGRRERGR